MGLSPHPILQRAKMVRFLKSGKVVIVLNGRYAGKKAVIVKNFDDGDATHPYGHALVAGIERYPRKVTKGMSQKKIHRRSNLKPFVRLINYNHLMPTRYTIDVDVKSVINKDALADPSTKRAGLIQVKEKFSTRYTSGKNSWFFKALRF